MKTTTKFKMLSCLLILIGIGMFIWGFFENYNPTGNRYAAMFSYEENIIYYANHNIYKYNNEDIFILAKDVPSPYFEILDEKLYFQKGNHIFCKDIANDKDIFDYPINMQGKRWLEMYLYEDIIVIKQWTGEEEVYVYLDSQTGEEIEAEVNTENLGYQGKIYANFSPIKDGLDMALTDEDVLYVKYPGGKSKISSYHVLRDQSGKLSDVELLEETIPYSDRHDTIWNLKSALQAVVIPAIFILTGIFILWGKIKRKSETGTEY